MNSSRRIRVAVVFGGRSTEHQISCLSAGSVLRVLDPAEFEVLPVGITEAGQWQLVAGDPEALVAKAGRLPSVHPGEGRPVIWSADPARPLALLDPSGADSEFLGVDVVFPLLHGAYGEDGTVQGLFELAGVPYVGSGVLASAASMDKSVTKVLAASAGLAQAPYVVITDRDWTFGRQRALDAVRTLGLPLFVKPARAGSSVGISRVTEWDALEAAVLAAQEHDPKVVVEQQIVGQEVECAVLGRIDGRGPEASVCAEIRVSGNHDLYDFGAKYLDDSTELIVPALLSDGVADRVRAAACVAFDALGCEDYARVDFFVTANGEVLFNEINTIPGFTSISLFPRMWAATGVDYRALVARMVHGALAKRRGLR